MLFNIPNAALVDIALTQRRHQAHIQIQTGTIGQRFWNRWLQSLSCQVCRKWHHRNLYVNCPRIAAADQQLQQAQADEHNHHPQQPL